MDVQDPRPLRLLVVEDHGAVRRGLELYLTAEGFRVLGATGNPEVALTLAAETPPDVAVVDLDLDGRDGATLIAQLLDMHPRMVALAYTAHGGHAVGPAMRAGARGFVLKAGPPGRLAEAIVTLGRGGTYLDPLLGVPASIRRPDTGAAALSRREREILLLLAEGLTGAEAARQLFISPATVRTHVQNAMRKLGARTRAQAIALATNRSDER